MQVRVAGDSQFQRNPYAPWQRPVHIMTIVNETGKILSFDGEDHSEVTIDDGERE